jgi:hypothetical protein
MEGIRNLAGALQSSVTIRDCNIDRQFTIPSTHGLAFALGLLYHLKNPFYFLEALSRHCRYCFLSTRIMRVLPDGATNVANAPVAYLAGPQEVNGDDSNFWIFTDVGLRRLVTRTNWQPIAWLTSGVETDSDPVHPDKDERAFCLLESQYAMMHSASTYGLHDPEHEGWRWSERKFGVRIPVVHDGEVCLRFYIPDAVVAQAGEITIQCRADGVTVGTQVYSSPGEHEFNAVRAPSGDTMSIDFEVSHAMPPDDLDPRERAIVVAQITC